ncbi:MAG: transcription antitermination factor NusB [Coriobacteriaceae bacterium]|jgi:N utilization substance protein B|nr:transcription antitermination factor NusB [Coriobacteriaceae bacterium]
MCAKRHERTHARKCALQVLYQGEILDEPAARIAAEERYIDENGKLGDYTRLLLSGINEHLADIDAYLCETSENWALERMPIVDRSILRLATYEMLYQSDVPASVAINEAVELAKDFGGEDDSPRFVNGVLGRIAKLLEERSAKNMPDAEQPEDLEGLSPMVGAGAAVVLDAEQPEDLEGLSPMVGADAAVVLDAEHPEDREGLSPADVSVDKTSGEASSEGVTPDTVPGENLPSSPLSNEQHLVAPPIAAQATLTEEQCHD